MSEDRFQLLRLLEAILFASAEPIGEKALANRLPEGADLKGLLEELRGLYANRGIHLIQIEDRWAFRTAPDLAENQLKFYVHFSAPMSKGEVTKRVHLVNEAGAEVCPRPFHGEVCFMVVQKKASVENRRTLR